MSQEEQTKSQEEQTFEFSGRLGPGQVADYLENLARYVRAGHLRLSAGPDAIEMHLGQEIKMEVAAEVELEKGKGSLELELSWKRPPHFEEPLRIQAAEGEAAGPNLEISASQLD